MSDFRFSNLPADVQKHLLDELRVIMNTQLDCIVCRKSMKYALAELELLRKKDDALQNNRLSPGEVSEV